jgi:hypothetical protein
MVSLAGAKQRELVDDHHIARHHDLGDAAVPGSKSGIEAPDRALMRHLRPDERRMM